MLPEKISYLAISLPVVRRVSGAQVQPVEAVRKPSSQLELKRRHANAIHGDSQGQQGLGGGGSAEPEAPCRNGEVQRRAGESRCAARRRRAPREFERQARPVLGRESNRDRRALHRGQGGERRLLAVAGGGYVA